ncbi:MAG: hypothetical protein ACJA1I_000559 [Zhongshania marina]|jgi:hypothetical protein
MTPRPRGAKNADLAQYPGLGRYKDGRYYVEHPTTGRQASLKTCDKQVAIRRWAAVYKAWDAERGDLVAERIATKVSNLSNIDSSMSIEQLLKTWRTEQLEKDLVTAKRGGRKGKSISESTKKDYRGDCMQLEREVIAAKIKLNSPRLIDELRKLISPWSNQPTHYNGLRNTLSRVLSWAVLMGNLSRNPIVDIEKAVENRREVLIPDDHYVAITAELMTHHHNKQEFDGEWRARICDLMYMLSQSPIDIFGLQESQVSDPDYTEAGVKYSGSIAIKRAKTGEKVIIGMNTELRETIDWFRQWKREQHLISPCLLVYPKYLDSRSRGKPVTHRTMSSWWLEARTKAQAKHKFTEAYQLRDLRKRGLTDEAIAAGHATDKGAHATEAMRNYYVLDKPPKRAGNTLTRIGR